MITLLSFILIVIGLFTSKKLFKTYFNPLGTYTIIWMGMIIFLELKLLPFPPMDSETWLVIYGSYFLFAGGILIAFQKNRLSENETSLNDQSINFSPDQLLVFIAITGMIGLLSAYLQWQQLFDKYGSLPNIFLNGGKIYRLRVQGELTEVIPYLGGVALLGVYFSGVYIGRAKKINLLVILPFIAIILRDMAAFGRANALIATIILLVTTFVANNVTKTTDKKQKSFNTKIATLLVLLFTTVVIATSTVRSFRATYEDFKGASSQLSQTKDWFIISPSVYFYVASQIAVFNKYMIEENEVVDVIGENSLNFFYSMLSKLNITEKPDVYQEGYMVPIWSNTGTYLRDIHADFGIYGLMIIPFVLGYIVARLWFLAFTKKRDIDIILLSWMWSISIMSFLFMNTRSADGFIALILFFILIHIFKVLNKINYKFRLLPS